MASTSPVAGSDTSQSTAGEIRSPGTALVDLNRKKAAYERFGVPSY
jgi:hypothetical protein